MLAASAALPGVFPPVDLDGVLHVDGGVVAPVPVSRALELDPVRIWVLDVSGGTIGRLDERMSALDVLLRSFAVSRAQLCRDVPEDRRTRIVRLPPVDVGRLELRDFSRTADLIARGVEAGRQMVAESKLSASVPTPRRAERDQLVAG